MPAPRMSEREFIELYNALGPKGFSRKAGLDIGAILRRARRLRRDGYTLEGPNGKAVTGRSAHFPVIPAPVASHEAHIELRNGIGLIASDAHYWPGETSLMHRAFVWACKEFKPKFIVLNGDVMDFPRISRHAPIGWEKRPEVADEIEWAQDRTHEIVQAAGRAQKTWNLGNHDARFETRLATLAPEYARMHGVHLHDHFPLFQPAWATWVNKSVVIKHRFRGGIHAVHNNLLWSGKNMVTGHLHSAKVLPFTDYNGTRYGVDGGCLAEPSARAFLDYTEDNPKNWRSAFCLLTFRDGNVMLPELVLKWDDARVQFRGELITP